MTDTGHGESTGAPLSRQARDAREGPRTRHPHPGLLPALQRRCGEGISSPACRGRGSSSRAREASAAGIRKVHTPDEVWKRIHELGDDRSFHLIEQMVPGDLFHVDSLSANGQVVFAEVNAYWRPLLDVYQGGGVYATRTVRRDRPEVAELKRINAELLAGFGLGWGASHTEFMKAHADGQFYFIETSARVGGANTAEMVEHATGVNLWSEWAKLEVLPRERRVRTAAAQAALRRRGDVAVPLREAGYIVVHRPGDRVPARHEEPHRLRRRGRHAGARRATADASTWTASPATTTRCCPPRTRCRTDDYRFVIDD